MKQSHISKIIAFDPREKFAYRLRGAEITELGELTYKKYYEYISYLLTKDIQIETIHLDFSVDAKNIAGAIEDVAYEELGLDPDREYIIKYYHSAKAKNSYQLFIIPRDKLESMFDDAADVVGHIDAIVPAPLVYSVLYDDLLDASGVHCFIYFMRDDAFITFYKDGEYIYSKSIEYSLDVIFAQYIKSGGISMSEESFFDALTGRGDTRDPDFANRIMRIFGEAFMSLNDVIVYVKRVYNIERIDRLYLGSSAGAISGLGNFSENFFGLRSLAMKFNFGFHSKSKHVNQFTKMLLERGVKSRAGIDSNFTQYERPPAIHRRPSGQLIGILVGATILGLIPTAYHYISKKAIDGKSGLLLAKERTVNADVEKYKKLIDEKVTVLDTITQEVNSSHRNLSDKEKTLVSIYDKKVNYRLKSEQFTMFANDFEKFGIKSYDFKSSSDSYHLFLVAKSDQDITKLISQISKKYSKSIKFIDISIIARNEKDGTYQGLLRVDFK